MGKSFKSDRRFERKRERQQFNTVVKGAQSREFMAPVPIRDLHEAQANAEAQRRRIRAFSPVEQQSRRYTLDGLEMAVDHAVDIEAQPLSTGRNRLFGALYGGARRSAQIVSNSPDAQAITEAFYAAYDMLSSNYRENFLAVQQTEEDRIDIAVAGIGSKRTLPFNAVILQAINADRDIAVCVLPEQSMERLEEKHPDVHALLLSEAKRAGVDFVNASNPKADIYVVFGNSYSDKSVSLSRFFDLCSMRGATNYIIGKGMAAQAFGPIVRKTRLED